MTKAVPAFHPGGHRYALAVAEGTFGPPHGRSSYPPGVCVFYHWVLRRRDLFILQVCDFTGQSHRARTLHDADTLDFALLVAWDEFGINPGRWRLYHTERSFCVDEHLPAFASPLSARERRHLSAVSRLQTIVTHFSRREWARTLASDPEARSPSIRHAFAVASAEKA